MDILGGGGFINFVGGHTRVKRTFVHHSAAVGEVGQLSVETRGSKKSVIIVSANIPLEIRGATAIYKEYTNEAVAVGFRHTAIAGAFKDVGVNFFALDLMPLGAAETL